MKRYGARLEMANFNTYQRLFDWYSIDFTMDYQCPDDNSRCRDLPFSNRANPARPIRTRCQVDVAGSMELDVETKDVRLYENHGKMLDLQY